MIENIHRQRIERLAKELRQIDIKYWTYMDWISPFCLVPANPEDEFNDTHNLPECGTVACALGRACLIPEFQKEGLYLHGVASHTFEPRYRAKDGTTYCGAESAVAFFGMSYGDAQSIFVHGNYEIDPEDMNDVTPDMVADWLELYLARNK